MAGVPSCSAAVACGAGWRCRPLLNGIVVLDILYVLGVVALFAVVALVGRAVEKL